MEKQVCPLDKVIVSRFSEKSLTLPRFCPTVRFSTPRSIKAEKMIFDFINIIENERNLRFQKKVNKIVEASIRQFRVIDT